MADHAIYRAIVAAVQDGKLLEPFNAADFRRACPGFAKNTYSTFLPKHRVGNHGGNSELFVRVAHGQYELARPLLYGL